MTSPDQGKSGAKRDACPPPVDQKASAQAQKAPTNEQASTKQAETDPRSQLSDTMVNQGQRQASSPATRSTVRDRNQQAQRKSAETGKKGEGEDEDDENFDLQTDSLFAFNSLPYASIFGDIRSEEGEHDGYAVPGGAPHQQPPTNTTAHPTSFGHFGFVPQYMPQDPAHGHHPASEIQGGYAGPEHDIDHAESLPAMFIGLNVSGEDDPSLGFNAPHPNPAIARAAAAAMSHSKHPNDEMGYPYTMSHMGMYPIYNDGYGTGGPYDGHGGHVGHPGMAHHQMGLAMHPHQMGLHPHQMPYPHNQMVHMLDMDPYLASPGGSQNNSRSSSRASSPSQLGTLGMGGMGMGMGMMKDRQGNSSRKNRQRHGHGHGHGHNQGPGMAMYSEDRKRGEHQASKLAIAQIHTPQDLAYKVTALSKDQNGCRFLQSLLDENMSEWVDVIYQQVFHTATDLMVDPFGNYLCQKLIEKCSDEQRVEFINQVSDSLVTISLNIHGTRAVQKLIDCVDKPDQIQMVSAALGANVVPLVKDLNGNHVIQRCLQKFGANSSQFIFDAVARHLVDVATHRHGCCVLQRCIDHANETQRQLLVDKIGENALRLVQDPFGNYVVQYVLDLSAADPRAIMTIVVKFIGSVPQLSTQKFSSNVIEKCLDIADPDIQIQFLMEIAADGSVPVLLNDPYGNYVMQRALAVADDRMFELLCSRIRPHIPSMRSTPYGKRIHNKLLKKFPMLADNNNGNGIVPSNNMRPRTQGGYGMQQQRQHHPHHPAPMQAPQHMGSMLLMNPGHQMGMVQPIGMQGVNVPQMPHHHPFLPYGSHPGSWAV